MKNILKVAVFILAIVMVAMPSFVIAQDVGYSATVAVGQSTSATINNNNFGTILRNTGVNITNSLTLNNSGDFGATVDAKFTSNVSTTYGLVNGTNVIGGSNFSLRETSGTFTPLSNDNSNTQITTVPAGTLKNIDARLFVPSGATGGIYNGTVLLTFGNMP